MEKNSDWVDVYYNVEVRVRVEKYVHHVCVLWVLVSEVGSGEQRNYQRPVPSL